MSISTVTSEALQLKLRQLLPSQQGFGTDLSASDTIIPVIDLTAAAEGSDTPEYLQRAQAFGSQTAINAANSTVVVANSPGFYQITGVVNLYEIVSDPRNVQFVLNDGSTDKIIYDFDTITSSTSRSAHCVFIEFVIFLAAGESCSVTANVFAQFSGSVRQVADVNGTLVQPSGFNPQ